MKYFSLFSGIGGFELGIQQAYEQLRDAHRSEDRGSEADKTGDEGERLLSETGESPGPEKRSASQCLADFANERPLECERLQGFPDNWTKRVSDTQRYKCCGNAVTVNVIRDVCVKMLQ